jgi:hypothetical protein
MDHRDASKCERVSAVQRQTQLGPGGRYARLLAALPLALVVFAVDARAQDAPPPAPAPPDQASSPPPPTPNDAALEKAKDLFRQGVTLLGAGDTERALDLFLRSRAAFPSAKNTTNAAICLDQLGRYDEALELYEEVLTKFASDLDESDRAAIAPAMATLRQKVGSVDVSANVDGASIVIDGRARGTLPLTTPIRVLAGKRLVRVVKSGYVTSEKTVEVKSGETLRIDARLEPLAQAGLLRVEDPDTAGSQVFVDRVLMGTAPWEGTLGPGNHVVWTRKEDLGSAPMTAIVVQGQTVLIRAKSSPLGPLTRFDVQPDTAHVGVDGVDLGAGDWEGRLPEGKHTFTVSEEGYFRQSLPLVTRANDTKPVTMQVHLSIDRSHPRWPKAEHGQFSVDAFGGFAIGPTLGSQAEEHCPSSCSKDPVVTGWLAGVRGAYRFPFAVALELGAGYLSLGSSFHRTVTSPWSNDQYVATYELDDSIRLSGPFVLGSISYRAGTNIALLPRVGVGVLFAGSRDPIRGTGSAGGDTVPVAIEGAGTISRSAAAFVQGEVGGEIRFGAVHVGANVGGSVFVADGPSLAHGSVTHPPPASPDTCDTQSTSFKPGSIECAPYSDAVRGERAYGRFGLITVGVTLGYGF